MPVIESTLKLHWRGSTGRASYDGNQYTAVYRVQVSDPLDQSKVVLDWFEATQIPLGTPYEYANDVGLSSAVAVNINADRVLPTLTHWEIVVEYGQPSPDEAERLDADEKPTDDPLDWRPQIFVGGNLFRRPVQKAIYRGGYAAGFKYAAGSEIPPMNSAGMPFTNPPLEEEATQGWVILKGNVSSYSLDDVYEFEGVVNDNPFEINQRGITGGFLSLQSRIRRITIEPQRYKTIDYLRVGFELVFSDNWRTELLDVGTHLRACDTDPDGRGGTVGGANTPFPDDTPRFRAATDLHGELIGSKFLMDGAGGPLDICTPAAAVFGRWGHYEERSYLDVPLLRDLIESLS